MHPRAVPLLFLALLALFAACDTADPAAELVDFDRLFAPPSEAEVGSIVAEWQGRAASGAYDPGLVEVVYADDLLEDGSTIMILRHTTGASTDAHYGALRVPAGAGPFPVIVVHHGGDRGFDLGEYTGFFAGDEAHFEDIGDAAIVVFPTYRAETMRNTPVGDRASAGAASPWDRDVDDSLALLNAVFEVVPEADASRVGQIGISRGGGVALQMAARPLPADAPYQISTVVNYFGPTDLSSPGFRAAAEALALFDGTFYEQLPGALFFKNEILRPLRFGEIGYDEARSQVFRRSAAFYAARLPNTQAHHHRRDAVVPFDQFESLQAGEAQIAGAAEFYAYGQAGSPQAQFHSLAPEIMPDNGPRTVDFVFTHVIGQEPASTARAPLAVADPAGAR